MIIFDLIGTSCCKKGKENSVAYMVNDAVPLYKYQTE